MKTNRITLTAIITALALVTFVIEAQIPPITPIYGVKLGLANIFTMFALYSLGIKETLFVLTVRIVLGNLLTGQMMSFAYSVCGGVLALMIMLILFRFFPKNQIWVVSAICAVFHNIGQILFAIIITKTSQIIFYLPILVVSGIITGIFTGLCAQAILIRLAKLGFIELNLKNPKQHKSYIREEDITE